MHAKLLANLVGNAKSLKKYTHKNCLGKKYVIHKKLKSDKTSTHQILNFPKHYNFVLLHFAALR